MDRPDGSHRMPDTRLMLAQLRDEIRPQLRVVKPRKSRRGLRVKEIDISPLGPCLLSQEKPMVGTDIVSIKRTVSLGDALAKLSLRGIVVAIAFPAGLLTLHTVGFRLIALDVPEPRIRCQHFIQLIGVDTHLQVMQPFRDLGRVTRLFAIFSVFH
jgi:hypothetical protein